MRAVLKALIPSPIRDALRGRTPGRRQGDPNRNDMDDIRNQLAGVADAQALAQEQILKAIQAQAEATRTELGATLQGLAAALAASSVAPVAPASAHFSEIDVGRSYADPAGVTPHFTFTPAPVYPWADAATLVTITDGDRSIQRVIYHPHLCFLELCKHYKFESVVDVGCGEGNEAELFRFLGKNVATVNFDPKTNYYKADYFGDYLDVDFGRRFDCIWCSHVLEHIRMPGLFLDKLFADLNDDGVLALSVPYNEFNSGATGFSIGHHNRYNISLLLYQLICAGFDCRDAAVRVYTRQISVIVRKKPNGIERSSFADYATAAQYFPYKVEYYSHFDEPSVNWHGV